MNFRIYQRVVFFHHNTLSMTDFTIIIGHKSLNSREIYEMFIKNNTNLLDFATREHRPSAEQVFLLSDWKRFLNWLIVDGFNHD